MLWHSPFCGTYSLYMINSKIDVEVLLYITTKRNPLRFKLQQITYMFGKKLQIVIYQYCAPELLRNNKKEFHFVTEKLFNTIIVLAGTERTRSF